MVLTQLAACASSVTGQRVTLALVEAGSERVLVSAEFAPDDRGHQHEGYFYKNVTPIVLAKVRPFKSCRLFNMLS